jgi:Flp pilus assembly protein TadD
MPWARKKKKRWYHRPSLWVAAIVLLAAALAGPRVKRRYDRWSSDRHTERAREFHAKGDYSHALIDARAALRLNPENAKANRVVAETLEALGAPEAIQWRSRLDSLIPGDTENLLAWANDAIKSGDRATAERVLKRIQPADRNARYHDLAAAIAIGKRDAATAEAHWTEAARLDPAEDRHALNLATLRLKSKSPDVRSEALDALSAIATNPSTGIEARRNLLGDAMQQRDARRARELADALVADPAATFADKLHRLTTLRATGDPGSSDYLVELQKAAAAVPENISRMLGWMNANDLALLAIEWIDTLPKEIVSRPPASASVAETFAKAGQWQRLRQSVENGTWLEADYLRRAFLARALERLGESEPGAVEWKQAVAAARSSADSAQRLEILAKSARVWRWTERSEELMWELTNFPTCPKWVLDSLWTSCLAKGETVHLQMICGIMARTNFQDLTVRNNYIFLSLLTRTEEGNPRRAAEALFRDYPENPVVASTYALSLYQQGRAEEAVAIMSGMKPDDLRQPQVALYYGIFLTAAGQRDKAQEYLALSAEWPLLPEEKALLSRVKNASSDAAIEDAAKREGKERRASEPDPGK